MKTGGQESGAEPATSGGGPGHGEPVVWGPARPQYPPAWAGRFGEDRHGVFADFELNGVQFDWRWIPPGRFWMGSPQRKSWVPKDELPRHEVILTQGFWMGRTPVTQAQWGALKKENLSTSKGTNLPVETVTWAEAKQFAEWLSLIREGLHAKLPTEAEWEYACRAGTDGDFGDGGVMLDGRVSDAELDRLGWFAGNSGGMLHRVGMKAANGWGLHDMHGLVGEWCWAGKREYKDGLIVNPVGPCGDHSGDKRAVRGGLRGSFPALCRAASRHEELGGPAERWASELVGFRLVAVAPDGAR